MDCKVDPVWSRSWVWKHTSFTLCYKLELIQGIKKALLKWQHKVTWKKWKILLFHCEISASPFLFLKEHWVCKEMRNQTRFMFSVLLHVMHLILIRKAHWHVHENIHCLRYVKHISVNTTRRFKGRIKDFSNLHQSLNKPQTYRLFSFFSRGWASLVWVLDSPFKLKVACSVPA